MIAGLKKVTNALRIAARGKVMSATVVTTAGVMTSYLMLMKTVDGDNICKVEIMTGVIIRWNEGFEKALKKFTEAAKKKEAKRLNS